MHENGHSFNGTCYSRSECLELGGQPKGECADGYGVCCVCMLKKNLIIIKIN